jgi:cobalt-precorrin 5A hydrolase/precorrin-3B C17-methyltransferase
MDRAGLSPTSVSAVATIDLKVDERAVVGLALRFGVPVVTFPAETLAGVEVPNPSEVVAAAVGSPSVAEAAAVAAAGPGAVLVGEKLVNDRRDSPAAACLPATWPWSASVPGGRISGHPRPARRFAGPRW